MMYFIIIVLLIIIVVYRNKRNKINDQLLRVQKKVQYLESSELDLRNKNQNKEVVNQIKDSEVTILKEENNKLVKDYEDCNAAYNSLVKVVTDKQNKGEILATRDLNEILDKLKEDSEIQNYFIFNNIIIQWENNPRQLDHAIICNKGIFLVETKHWSGDIFHNINSNTLDNTKYEFLKDYVFQDNKSYYKTFVLKKDDVITYKDYSNNGQKEYPYQQIKNSTMTLYKCLKEELEKQSTSLKAVFVNGFIYFNHNNKRICLDGTEDNRFIALQSKDEIYEYMKCKREIYNKKDVDLIADLINNLKMG